MSLATRFAQHPLADGNDEPRFLGDGNEATRGDEPAFWMTPTDECLGAVDATGADIHLGLIMKLELALDESPPQPALQLQALPREHVHRGREELERISFILL